MASHTDPTIQCPNCKHDIKLTESLAGPLVESARKEFEAKSATREAEIQSREKAVQAKTDAANQALENVNAEVQKKLDAERTKLVEAEAKKAGDKVAADLRAKETETQELRDILAANNQKLAEAQTAQADLLRKERLLDQQRREMDLTIEKKISDGLVAAKMEARREAETALSLKVTEKDQVILGMSRQIEELRIKAEQGSQQAQGEALEVVLEDILRNTFVRDQIEPVAKGQLGADVVQKVFNSGGVACGSMIYESKRTKNWSDGWLPKLRDDQRAAGAEVAIIVTTVLPKEIETFGCIEGVWITDPRYAVPLATCLRQALIDIHTTRKAGEGQATKMEMVYQYLTGPRFRHRIGAVVEAFAGMKEDLDKERKATTRLWAKREGQINGVLDATAGLYGDLQGIAGAAVQDLPSLTTTEPAALTT